jgi:hypothetical protein
MQKRDSSRVGRRGVLEGAVVAGAAALTSPMAARSQTAPSLVNTSDDLPADARLMGWRRWFLGASKWPGVVPSDVEIGNVDDLAQKYPAIAADLREIAASVRPVATSDAQ